MLARGDARERGARRYAQQKDAMPMMLPPICRCQHDDAVQEIRCHDTGAEVMVESRRLSDNAATP